MHLSVHFVCSRRPNVHQPGLCCCISLDTWVSVNPCGSGRSNSCAMEAQSTACPVSAAGTCMELCLARAALLVIPKLTKMVFVMLQSQRRGDCSVPMGSHVLRQQISWGRDNLYKMFVQRLAQWSSSLSWGCSHKANLHNNSSDY